MHAVALTLTPNIQFSKQQISIKKQTKLKEEERNLLGIGESGLRIGVVFLSIGEFLSIPQSKTSHKRKKKEKKKITNRILWNGLICKSSNEVLE